MSQKFLKNVYNDKIVKLKKKICVSQDLDEDVVITLTAKNPQAPQNIIRFDHTIGEYVTVKLAESMIDHLEIESTSIHKDSDEGQKQLMNEGKKQDGKRERKNTFLLQTYFCVKFIYAFRHQTGLLNSFKYFTKMPKLIEN